MFDFRLAALTAVIISSCGICPAHAQKDAAGDELYKAETIVTGTGVTERMRGFKIGVREVLIKLTGRPKIADGERAKAVIDGAPQLIADYTYEDRMKDIPIHDEQGTRDRPHFLRMRFDRTKFNAALKQAGIKRWSAKRPTVAVWLGIREPRGKYILTRDGDGGYGQREVLKEASARRGIPIVLPLDAQKDVSFNDIVKSNWSPLWEASKALGANAVLYGTLEFDGKAHWDCQWVAAGGRAYAKWKLRGVTFDEALKDAIDRVMAAHARQAKYSKEN